MAAFDLRLDVEIPVAEERREGKNRHTVYRIRVTWIAGQQEYFICRRYSEFYTLYQQLSEKKLPGLPPYFPSKKYWGRMNPKVIEKRRGALSFFLRSLLALDMVLSVSLELRRFLNIEELQDFVVPELDLDGNGMGEVTMARALFSFEGTDETDLTFAAGDLIIIRSQEDLGWWQGELNGIIGIFPHNYVRVLPNAKSEEALGSQVEISELLQSECPAPPTPPSLEAIEREKRFSYHSDRNSCGLVERLSSGDCTEHPATEGYPHVRALYNYTGDPKTDLAFAANEVITVLEIDVDSGWWFGELNGRTGLFPQNFVSMVEDEDEEPSLNAKRRSLMSPAFDGKPETLEKSKGKGKEDVSKEDKGKGDEKDEAAALGASGGHTSGVAKSERVKHPSEKKRRQAPTLDLG